MTERREPRLGDLFGACHALPATSRLRLATLLAVPGRLAAILPEELAALALPGSTEQLEAVAKAIRDGLGPEAVAALAEARISEVVPAIDLWPGAVATTGCDRRLRGVLERNRVTTWDTLGRLTVGEIAAWHGVGARSSAALLGLAVDAGLALLVAGDGPVADEHPCLAVLDRALRLVGDDRDRAVFEQRSLRLDGRPAVGRLALALGIGHERVRKLRALAEARLRDVLGAEPAVHALAAEIAQRLGTAAPTTVAAEIVAAAGLLPLPDSRSLLALWLAGPYHPVEDHPGWIATDSGALAIETRRLLGEDGGVRLVEQVTKELGVLGLTPPQASSWLLRQPVTVVDGLVVLTEGQPAPVAERVLSATGSAMTVDDLWSCAWSCARPGRAGRGSAPGEEKDRLRAVLLADRRFTRVTPDRFELTEWGGTPYRPPDTAEPPGPAYPSDDRGRCWLEVQIDEGVLAGAEAPVSPTLLEALGIAHGARRSFATRYGPVALSSDAARPTRGSVRPVALASGASVGDTVAIGFHPDDSVAEVRLTTAESNPPTDRSVPADPPDRT